MTLAAWNDTPTAESLALAVRVARGLASGHDSA
jgi:hypothetical protein